tara:strand:+ start:7680 stop:8567 length:888 start_codon:yes stop_codon:yes gene_type:complete
MKIVVTGGRGFIGSHFVEECLKKGWKVTDIDCMTYAAHEKLPWDDNGNYKLIKKDIATIKSLPKCDYVVNFAAESHVDNSIRDTEPFIHSNILGVHNLLQLIRGKRKYDRPLFFQISTDEVYGDIEQGSFLETDTLKPSNPYSATKASAEMLVLSYARTYGIDYLITRSGNNYGPRQYEEKLIPKCIDSIENNKKIPIHGDGSYIRDWTHVKDNVSGLIHLIEGSHKNQIFNIAAQNHLTNLEVVDTILGWYDKGREMIEFVSNRWGQDTRYSINTDKILETGWKPIHLSGIHRE